MTDAEKEKLREGFQKPVENQTEEKIENVWTHEDMLEIAKKIMKRMGWDESKLY